MLVNDSDEIEEMEWIWPPAFESDDSPCTRQTDYIVPQQCSVVTVGTGDTGQLGLGPVTLVAKTATRVPRLSGVVQVDAGGMHTVCLDRNGKVRRHTTL